MAYAHVTDGVVDGLGAPPNLALVDGDWIDLRTLEPAKLAAAGWFPLIREPRPADTASTTWDRVESFDEAAVTISWDERPKTPEELDADDAEANAAAIEAAVDDALITLRAVRDDAQTAADRDPSWFTNARVVASVQGLAAAVARLATLQIRVIRFVFRRLSGTD